MCANRCLHPSARAHLNHRVSGALSSTHSHRIESLTLQTASRSAERARSGCTTTSSSPVRSPSARGDSNGASPAASGLFLLTSSLRTLCCCHQGGLSHVLCELETCTGAAMEMRGGAKAETASRPPPHRDFTLVSHRGSHQRLDCPATQYCAPDRSGLSTRVAARCLDAISLHSLTRGCSPAQSSTAAPAYPLIIYDRISHAAASSRAPMARVLKTRIQSKLNDHLRAVSRPPTTAHCKPGASTACSDVDDYRQRKNESQTRCVPCNSCRSKADKSS